jgi:hypothetical protein
MVVCALLAPALLSAQGASASSPPPFPTAWAGRWVGELVTVSPPDSVRNRVPVVRDIPPEPQGTAWTWRTVFNGDTVNGVRPYRLLVRDAARGRYVVDEGNGLELDATWVAGTLISVFQVGGRVLESREEVRGDTLVQELIWWSATPSGRMRGAGPMPNRGWRCWRIRWKGASGW